MSNVGEFPMKLNSWGSLLLLLLLLFFFRNREGFVKQLRHMFSLTRFNELHFIIVYTTAKIEWFPRNTLWFGTKTNRSNCTFNIPVAFSFLWCLVTGDPAVTNWSREYLCAKSSCLLERLNLHNYQPNTVFTVEENPDHFFDTAFA